MAIKETEYPIYEPGQTLTADELNTTTAFLMARDRLLGKLVGFGVNAGLGGTVAGNKLTIAPGRAIDQAGTPLALVAAHDITLPPTPVTPSYDFISSAAAGFSIVIEARDDVAPPPACGEAGCGGHPELHTPVVDVRVVRGRLTGSWMKFEQEDLLKVRPILVDASANPTGWTYAKLRDAIVQRLTNGGDPLVSAALIAKLQATDMAAGDLPGVKGYKCGWLNMVLFATLDLLRCEALCALLDDKTTTRNGVVLGWLHQETTGWFFDCSYRHDWEPPRGFTEAFLGGTCSDPCALYRAEVEGLLGSYAPPDPPPAGWRRHRPPAALLQAPQAALEGLPRRHPPPEEDRPGLEQVLGPAQGPRPARADLEPADQVRPAGHLRDRPHRHPRGRVPPRGRPARSPGRQGQRRPDRRRQGDRRTGDHQGGQGRRAGQAQRLPAVDRVQPVGRHGAHRRRCRKGDRHRPDLRPAHHAGDGRSAAQGHRRRGQGDDGSRRHRCRRSRVSRHRSASSATS